MKMKCLSFIEKNHPVFSNPDPIFGSLFNNIGQVLFFPDINQQDPDCFIKLITKHLPTGVIVKSLDKKILNKIADHNSIACKDHLYIIPIYKIDMYFGRYCPVILAIVYVGQGKETN